MCGVEDLSDKLRQKRLRCFGLVKRAEGDVVEEVRVGQQEGLGKSDCVMEDTNLLGVEEHVLQDQRMWKAVTTHPTPSYTWENTDVK